MIDRLLHLTDLLVFVDGLFSGKDEAAKGAHKFNVAVDLEVLVVDAALAEGLEARGALVRPLPWSL